MGRDEGADVAAQMGHFLDNARAEKGISVFGHHKNRFDTFIQLTIHQSHLEFKFKVGDGAQAADDSLGGPALDVFNEQAIEGVSLDVGEVLDGLGDHFLALGHGKERAFAFAERHRHDDAVEQPGSPLQNVQMAVGERIEAPGIDGSTHDRHASMERAKDEAGIMSYETERIARVV